MLLLLVSADLHVHRFQFVLTRISVKNLELLKTMGSLINTEEYKLRMVDWMTRAVQISTEAFDDMLPPGEDPRWEVFLDFHKYLEQAFPLAHATVKRTKVNHFALVYEWKGSDSSLLPILLAAHQDVVPVDPQTVDQWIHPPYSGYFDGEFIWGRGSSDDKSALVSIMATIESLLEHGFQPTRTVVLAFGIDEEAFGKYGAKYLAIELEGLYGKDGFAFLVDEGGGFVEQYGVAVATPGVAEKGYLDVRLQVNSPGGHSSVPPVHTTIGLLSEMLVEYEKHPFIPYLSRDDTLYGLFQCYAAHAPGLPKKIRKLVKRSVSSQTALHELEHILFKTELYATISRTTQAIDMISGGVKSNALPEEAYAIVNHRIQTHSSVEETIKQDGDRIKGIAAKYNLSLEVSGEPFTDASVPSSGSIKLSPAFGHALNPAPRTPIGPTDIPYQFLSSVIKTAYNTHRGLEGSGNIIVAPGMSTGNTDTQYYWNLTRHIFRYNHSNGGETVERSKGTGAHTVNEAVSIDGVLEKARFFVTLILNADEATTF
ncbi:carboxypeptidase S [Fistulina hepatica ATCC 64428]|uniref:Carboxypeptidase S n=1 Tax=Fistulina hepatica ATCC 64428 TaxID=1128425 RepID=A0A0D7AFS4_9AGAR|nr:carboxypeptidase S [Fistulina hepatica ATCC 64428]